VRQKSRKYGAITPSRVRETTDMLLTVQQAHELLAKHGVFAREICDKCGAVLGAVRFTRRDEVGVWCSRECRDGRGAHAPGTCKACHAKLPDGKRRGASYCDDACRKAHKRVSDANLSRTKRPIYAPFSLGNSRDGIQGHLGVFRAS
jgi:hypothetical protein